MNRLNELDKLGQWLETIHLQEIESSKLIPSHHFEKRKERKSYMDGYMACFDHVLWYINSKKNPKAIDQSAEENGKELPK